MNEENKSILQVYADGVNAYIENVSFSDPEASAKLLPPEFYLFGLTGDNLKPWHPVDSLMISRTVGMHLTWSFG